MTEITATDLHMLVYPSHIHQKIYSLVTVKLAPFNNSQSHNYPNAVPKPRHS